MDQLKNLLDNKTSLSDNEKLMFIQTFEDVDKLESKITLLIQDKCRMEEDYNHLMRIVIDLGQQLKKSTC